MARRKVHDEAQKPRRVLPEPNWPAAHRALWAAGIAPRTSRLARPRHADTLRPLSIRNAARAWGAYLVVLAEAGIDIAADDPAALVTPDHVASFVDTLAARGNAAGSIRVRLFDLRTALRIMQPAQDLGWLTRPGGVSINDWFEDDPEEAEKEILDPRVLTALGWDLIASANALPATDEDALRMYRNGLICLLLAALPIRIGTLSLMRLGVNVFDHGADILLRFSARETKNRKPLECAVPDHLLSAFRHHLDAIRPRMVRGEDDRWFWRNPDGTRFRYAGIMQMFRRVTAQKLGKESGTHVSRHGMATALADLAPDRPGLAAAVLGVGEGVVDRHYRRAEIRQAARLATNLLEAERDELRLRARTRFGHRASD